MEVDRFLIVFSKKLDPAAVALAHRVGVVIPNVNRGTDGARGDGHNDRETEPGGVVNRFSHIKQPLGSGSGVGTAAGDGTADCHAHGCEFTFNVQEFAVFKSSFFDHGAEVFDDMGLRRDRVGADDFGAAKCHSLSDA